MTSTRRQAYEAAIQQAIDEVEAIRSQTVPATLRAERQRRIASLERQIIGLTSILDGMR